MMGQNPSGQGSLQVVIHNLLSGKALKPGALEEVTC